ncbi:DUF3616 domain-containing protein [Rhizobium sp. NZLR8]|uniref:DUF3616 domain-containing protein n=1 Tax=Rhizobium sp. NZLR8 TaxID=2731104 RepID=UPI001C833F17|nr:DUF3616 domain-containing protein [Rhizobium sp. NZLR8]MBX5157679.1 DUF3616 domain-containing protein [Rhizobium sp. NZLR8]
MLVGDEYRYALTFELDDNRIVLKDRVYLLPKKASDGQKFKEADAEGISFSDDFFYLVGSHGRNKEGKKQDSRYFVYRIRAQALKDGDLGTEDEVSDAVEVSSKLEDLLDHKEVLKDPNQLAPEHGGTNIEGIAVQHDKLFVGFRGPLPDSQALIGETSVRRAFDEAQGDIELHPVDLGEGQSIRDLVAYEDRLLILSGPQDRQGGKAAVYQWNPNGGPSKLADLNPAGSPARQPETLMVLSTSNNIVRCLVFDDGDVPLNPRIYEIPIGQ